MRRWVALAAAALVTAAVAIGTPADPAVGGANSSVSQLTVPPGATVARAYLSWGADLAQYRLGRSTLRRCDASHPDATVPSGAPRSHPVRMRAGQPVRDQRHADRRAGHR
ncbi:MAG TPA: hypothetical protein VGN37_23345 [Actinocatenispora sp.]